MVNDFDVTLVPPNTEASYVPAPAGMAPARTEEMEQHIRILKELGDLQSNVNPEETITVELLPLGRTNRNGRRYDYSNTFAIVNSEQFQSRLKRGEIIGEVGSPVKRPKGWTDKEWRDRLQVTLLERACLSVRSVRIDKDALMGEIQPFGPMGYVLRLMRRRGEPIRMAMRGYTSPRNESTMLISMVLSFRGEVYPRNESTMLISIITFDLIPPETEHATA